MNFEPDEFGNIEITVDNWKLSSWSSAGRGDPHVYGEVQDKSRDNTQTFEITSDGVLTVDILEGEQRGYENCPSPRYIPMNVLKVAFELWEFRKAQGEKFCPVEADIVRRQSGG